MAEWSMALRSGDDASRYTGRTPSNASKFSASSRKSTSSTGTSALRLKLRQYAKTCAYCRKADKLPLTYDKIKTHVDTLKKHFDTVHKSARKAGSTTFAKPKPMDSDPVQITVKDWPKDIPTESNSVATRQVSETTKKRPAPSPDRGEKQSPPQKTLKDLDMYTDMNQSDLESLVSCKSASALCPPDKAKSTGAVPKKRANEFGSLESVASISMDTNLDNLAVSAQAPPTPTKTAKLRDHLINTSPTEYNVTTQNRFDPLNQEPVESQPDTAATIKDKASAAPKQAAKPVKQATPPPIVIVGRDNGNITKSLDTITSGDYWVKYTANSVIVHTKNQPDYDAVIRACNQEKLAYHSYSAAGRKTHAFVLRGMAQRHTPEEILDHIRKESSINAQKVFKMRTLGAPLFLVVTDASQTISKLNKEMPRVLKVAVQWENRRSANPITQCRRCQLWGHSMGNCRRPVRCSKCAESHEITQCSHNDKPKCANCRGEHRAFSRDCPVYLDKLAQYMEKFPQTAAAKPSYVNAPPPTNPAWRNTNLSTPGPIQAPPPAQTTTLYNQNFPGAPGSRRNTSAQAWPQQAAPVAAPTGISVSSSFQILKGKWDEVNSLINFDSMIKALDIYVSMLRSATNNEELFNVSREFFCNVLPSINLAP